MRSAPLIAFLMLAFALVSMLIHQSAPRDPFTARAEAMPALTVTTLDGGAPWQADSLKGHVTLINFFASWCSPCAAEMPELAALKKQFPNLRMHGIAWNDQPATLKQWLKKHGNPFQQVWFDKTGDSTIALGLQGIPESFIVDASGMVRFRLAGALTRELREGELAALITQLQAEAAHAK